jgi:hypothetical protein
VSSFGKPWQFHGDFERAGYYELPRIERQAVDLEDLKLIRFNSITKHEKRDADATVHFFLNDDKFDEVWNKPDSYIQRLRQYKQVLSPDFSLYANWPLPVQLFNTFRSRWCGWYWQQQGLTVIPTIAWALRDSYRFCFDGVEPGSTVAVSTIGCMDAENEFMAGYSRMLKIIDPACVINYGDPFEAMTELSPLVNVRYRRTARIAPRTP